MKILIAYDGSECVDAAVFDMPRAGLPCCGNVLALCVGRSGAQGAVPESAGNKIRSQLPGWTIACESSAGSPEDVILSTSRLWRPDLLIIGARMQSGRTQMGNVTLDVAHRALCSVRVVPSETAQRREGPIRLLLGYDGSSRTQQAIGSVGRRSWPARTEARVLSVITEKLQHDSKMELTAKVQDLCRGLETAGIDVHPSMIEGDPRSALLRDAECWNADTIFVGAHAEAKIDHFLMGSVPTAVVSRARCAVEIVR